VVYRGDRPVPRAREALDEVRTLGVPLLFLTNNSSRTPQEVARTVEGFGIRVSPEEVLTSGLATAALLRRTEPAVSTAFVIGERGLRRALVDAGIQVLVGEPASADVVVVGWDRSADYSKLRTAALLVQRGARLVATNADGSYPAPDGLWPGAGALLAVVTTTTGVIPTVVGKPARPLFEAAAERTGAVHPLVVGDRLDTDVSGAAAMGWDALLVLTGVARPADLLHCRDLPTYVGGDLSILVADPAPPPGRFRSAGAADSPGIASLLEAVGLSAPGTEGRLPRTLVCEGTDEEAQAQAQAPAATACLEPLGPHGLLRSVAVRPDLRGLGLGTLAVASAIAVGRGSGLGEVALFTETAPGFFEKLGFRPVGRNDLPEAIRRSPQAGEECAETAQAMVLSLDPPSADHSRA